MTLIEYVYVFLGLALAVLAGIGIACYRLRGSLRTRPPVPAATLMQAITKAMGGGGGGPIEPF
jgi:hypothetical protein